MSRLLLQIVIVISYDNIVVITTKLEAVGVFQRVCAIELFTIDRYAIIISHMQHKKLPRFCSFSITLAID